MGEPARRLQVPAEPAAGGVAAVYAAEVEAIARLREKIGTAPLDPSLSRRLAEHFGAIRAAGVETGDLALGEIGLSCELVFAALAARPGVLSRDDLCFLDNVIAVIRELGETAGEPRRRELPGPMADAFDRLLARFERA